MSSIVSFPISVPGKWNISGTFGGYTIKETAQVTEKGSTVQVELEFQDATITVTSPIGTSLVVSNGDTQYTKISTGLDVFNVYIYGEWTVSGTLEGFVINSVSVTVEPDNNYPVQLTIQTATLTVTAPIGVVVSVSGGGQIQQKTSLNGTVVFELTQLDTYTISGTLDNLSTNTVQVQVTDFTSYTATLTIDAATIQVNTITDVAVTIQNGSETYTKVAGESGQVQFLTQTTGEWTVNGVLEGYTFEETSVDVQGMQEYPVDLFPLFATITVTAPDETVVTATNGELEESAFVESGTAVIRIYSFGEWTVSGEKDGLFTNTETVQVSDWIDYPITLTIFVATITVTTPTGTSVTAQNGINQQIKVAQSGDTVVFQVQQTGNWTLSAQFGTQSDSEVVNVTTGTNYTARLWVPTIVPTVVTGSVVTAIQGGTTLTETSVSGKVKFYVPSLGEWTVSATLNEQESNTVIVDVQEDRDYPMLLSYEFATITVQTEPNTEVTAQNGAIIITGTSNSNGEVVFEVATMGTWTLSATLDGVFVSESVLVSDTINYDVTLSPPEYRIVYQGVATPLSENTYYLGSANTGDYLLFGGGTTSRVMNWYNNALVKGTATSLGSLYWGYTKGGSVGDKAIFCDGINVVYYNNSLVKTTLSDLPNRMTYFTVAKNQSYVMFGASSDGSSGTLVFAYNSNATRTKPTQLSKGRNYAAGGNVGDYAIFAGGRSGSTVSTNVTDAYNLNLTRIVPDALSLGKSYAATANLADKILIGGGTTNRIEIYTSDLTRTSVSTFYSNRILLTGGNLRNFAIFAGGKTYNNVDSYNSDLVKVEEEPLSVARGSLASGNIGEYYLVAGGSDGSTGTNVVDIYTTEVV